jgi:hypothetical protein
MTTTIETPIPERIDRLAMFIDEEIADKLGQHPAAYYAAWLPDYSGRERLDAARAEHHRHLRAVEEMMLDVAQLNVEVEEFERTKFERMRDAFAAGGPTAKIDDHDAVAAFEDRRRALRDHANMLALSLLAFTEQTIAQIAAVGDEWASEMADERYRDQQQIEQAQKLIDEATRRQNRSLKVAAFIDKAKAGYTDVAPTLESVPSNPLVVEEADRGNDIFGPERTQAAGFQYGRPQLKGELDPVAMGRAAGLSPTDLYDPSNPPPKTGDEGPEAA